MHFNVLSVIQGHPRTNQTKETDGQTDWQTDRQINEGVRKKVINDRDTQID